MAKSTLQKITARAKQIRKGRPSMLWTDAIKKASAELKKPAGKKKATPKPRAKLPVKVVKTQSVKTTIGRMPTRKKPTAKGKMKEAQQLLLGEVGILYAKKLMAPTKTKRKKLQKQIVEKQRDIRRLGN